MRHLLKKITFITIIIVIFMNSIVLGQVKPETTGESVLLMEQTTNSIVYSKNPDAKMFPASTTKMLTALVTLDYLNKDEIITLGEEITNLPPNSSTAVGVAVGQTLTIENALRGLLLSSGNDIACSLALNVAQKKENKTDMVYADAEKVFSELMNEKAKSLGATNSNFVNPHGYHNEQHYTTATDLYTIAKALLANDTLKDIVMSGNFTGDGADKNLYGDKNIVKYNWKNSNLLISSSTYKYKYATGVKTGNTEEAGRCLVASAEKNGKKLIAVILNSTEAARWQDAIKLFDYSFDNFEFASIQKKGDLIDKVLIRDNSFTGNSTIDIIADKDINAFVPLDVLDTKSHEIQYYDNFNIASNNQPARLSLPLKSGEIIGTVTYKVGNEPILKTEIKATSDKTINLIDNKENYKIASKQKKKKDIIKSLGVAIILILVLIMTFLIFRMVRIRLIRKRRRMRMRMKKQRNIKNR